MAGIVYTLNRPGNRHHTHYVKVIDSESLAVTTVHCTTRGCDRTTFTVDPGDLIPDEPVLPSLRPLEIGTRVNIEHRDWPDRTGTVRGFNPATGKYQIELDHLYPGDRDGGGKIWLGRGALFPRPDLPGTRRYLRIDVTLEPGDDPDPSDPIALIDLLAERHDRLEAHIMKEIRP